MTISNKRPNTLFRTIICLSFLTAAIPTQTFAAAAFSTGNGQVISCEAYSSETNAANCVERSCKKAGISCDAPITYKEGCVAVATSPSGNHSYGIGRNLVTLIPSALERCTLVNGTACRLTYTNCER